MSSSSLQKFLLLRKLTYPVICFLPMISKKFSSFIQGLFNASKTGIAEPPVKAKPQVDMDVLLAIHPEFLEDSFVYVHCHFKNKWTETLIRIWSTTFLIDAASSARCKLVHAENITLAPAWTLIPDKQEFTFLLIFSSLPKSCKRFDLVEEITQPGGFFVKDIQRNETDVYHIDLKE